MINKTNFDEEGVLIDEARRTLERVLKSDVQDFRKEGLPISEITRKLYFLGTALIQDSEKAKQAYSSHPYSKVKSSYSL